MRGAFRVFGIVACACMLSFNPPPPVTSAPPDISELCPDRVPPDREFPIIVRGSGLDGGTFSIDGLTAPIVIQCGETRIVQCPAHGHARIEISRESDTIRSIDVPEAASEVNETIVLPDE